jgi:hypothetical protein
VPTVLLRFSSLFFFLQGTLSFIFLLTGESVHPPNTPPRLHYRMFGGSPLFIFNLEFFTVSFDLYRNTFLFLWGVWWSLGWLFVVCVVSLLFVLVEVVFCLVVCVLFWGFVIFDTISIDYCIHFAPNFYDPIFCRSSFYFTVRHFVAFRSSYCPYISGVLQR